MKALFLIISLFVTLTIFAQKIKYKVVYIDGSIKTVVGSIERDYSGYEDSTKFKYIGQICLRTKSDIIYPDQTQYISYLKKAKEIKGYPSSDSSAWLFQHLGGDAISAYTIYPRNSRADYIKKNDSTVKYSPAALAEMVKDNPKLYKRSINYSERQIAKAKRKENRGPLPLGMAFLLLVIIRVTIVLISLYYTVALIEHPLITIPCTIAFIVLLDRITYNKMRVIRKYNKYVLKKNF
jgi:hypothetical protein